MNGLVKINNDELVTDTLVIAEETGNDHASVIKLVRQHTEDIEEFGLLDFKSESSAGRPREFAVLNEPQSTLLITYMRNNDRVREFKKRLVSEFYKMRSALYEAPNFAVPQTRAEALRLAADLEDQLSEAKSKIEADAPKVEALDMIASSEGDQGIRATAKILGKRQKEFISDLISWGCVYRESRSGTLLPYHEHEVAKRFCVETDTRPTKHGYMFTTKQTMITPKGITYLAMKYAKQEAKAGSNVIPLQKKSRQE